MTLEMKELEAAVEGILFASGEPVHIDRICLPWTSTGSPPSRCSSG